MPRKKQITVSWTKNKIVRTSLMAVGLIAFSYINATNFDKTELKMLGETFALWSIIHKYLPD